MNVLDVQNLTLSFGENTLFSDLSFDIQDKENETFSAFLRRIDKVIKKDKNVEYVVQNKLECLELKNADEKEIEYIEIIFNKSWFFFIFVL